MQHLFHNHNYKFPWQDGNHFELLVDGPQFFPAMLADIQAATQYILLEMYLVNPGRITHQFFSALIAATQRGVQVCVLLDGYGCRNIDEQQRQDLRQAGVYLAVYNPLATRKRSLMLFRDHRKLLLVDGNIAYVGGAALSDELDDVKNPAQNWRENMVRIRGRNVLQWQQLFAENWVLWASQPLPVLATNIAGDGNQCGRVTMTQGPQLMEIKRSFLNQVRRARQRVWFCTAYFAPSRKLRSVLCKAAARGVDVRILIPGDMTDNPMARYLAQHYYARLLRHGVRIFEYQPRFMHAKLVLCDDWVSMGSCNVDRWNFLWNLDANQEIQDAQFSLQVAQMFENDYAQSREITTAAWRERSWLTRLKITFWAQYVHGMDVVFNYLGVIRYWRLLRKKVASGK